MLPSNVPAIGLRQSGAEHQPTFLAGLAPRSSDFANATLLGGPSILQTGATPRPLTGGCVRVICAVGAACLNSASEELRAWQDIEGTRAVQQRDIYAL